MTLQDYKKAITRLFYDMINADGVIEDEEIIILEDFKKKYGISSSDIARAHQITTTEAMKILVDWQSNEESLPEYRDSKYTAKNAFMDIDAISGCDNDRDINEAKLLAALNLCLSPAPDGVAAIPIKYRERKLRFSRKEIIYLSSEYDESVHNDLKRSKKFIECLLAIYGYDFIYLPDVIEFLSKKAESKLLGPILMFSKPLYLREGEDAEKFVDDIQNITTEDFTRDFIRDAGLIDNLKPSLLIKLKTSTIHEKDDKGEWRPVKYTDFIALPIQGSVEHTARLLPESILGFTKDITSLVRRQLDEKLYCKGIHQTLIDYTVEQSQEESIKKIIIKRWSSPRSPQGVKFVGLKDPFVGIQPKALNIYILIAMLSMSAKAKGIPFSPNKDASAIFAMLYERSPELYNGLNVQISNIRRSLDGKLNVHDAKLYSPQDVSLHYKLNINPDLVFIQDGRDADSCISLKSWIDQRRVPVGGKLRSLSDIIKELEG
jgi:hypothetical protein